MIIHSPIISGSLTFADGSTITIPAGSVLSGSFSGSMQVHRVQGHLLPDGSHSYDLGSSTHPWRDLYISGGTAYTDFGTFGFGSSGFFVNDTAGTAATIQAKTVEIIDTDTNEKILLTSTAGTLNTEKADSDGTISTDKPISALSGSFTGSIQDGTLNGTTTVTSTLSVTGTTTVGTLSGSDALFSGGITAASFTGDGSGLSGVTSYTNSDNTAHLNSLGVLSGSSHVGDYTFSNNLTVSGDLSVEGTTTSVNSTTVNIGDNILNLNYGGSATEGGIYVKDGTGASTTSGSLLWDATNDYWKAGVLGSENEIITTNNIVRNLPNGTISSSAQITNGSGLISQSTQVNADSITNFDSNVKSYMNAQTVISQSSQVDADSVTNFDSNVLTYIDSLGVISGSDQLTSTFDTRYLNTNGDSVVSSSAQLYTDLDARYVKDLGEGAITSSGQVDHDATNNFDSNEHIDHTSVSITAGNGLTGGGTIAETRTINIGQGDGISVTADAIAVDGTVLRTTGDGVVSGSTQINADETTGWVADVKTQLNNNTVISSSAQITITESQISDLDHYTDSDWDTRLATKSTSDLSEGTNLYYTDARVKTKLTAEGVISGSSQITITQSQISDLDHYTDTDFDNRLATKTTSNLTEGSNLYYTDNRVKTKLTAEGVVSGSATQVRSFLNVENGADVTDTANVTAAGALMDSEITNLSQVKAFDSSDYATAAQGAKADSAQQPPSEGAFVDGDKTKLDGIETGADVTDTTNVTAAGALMDSELASITHVKALNQSVISGASPTFSTTNMTDATNKRFMTDAQESKLDGIESSADVTDSTNVVSSLVGATAISSGNKTTIQSNLGVDAAGTKNSTDVTLAGSYNYITAGGTDNQTLTLGQVDASTDISNLNTDNVSEGSTNKYASTANVKSALNANLGTLTLGDSNDVISIAGTLTVTGTTNFINSNTVNIGDNIIVLNADVTGTPTADGGVRIERGTQTNASIIWSEANDYWSAGLSGAEERIVVGAGNTSITTLGTITTGTWQGTAIADAYLSSNTAHLSGTQTFSGAKTFSAAVNISNSTASTSKTTGALKVTGGVGIQGALNVGGDVVAYASSDERLKDNIELISNPIEKVQSLKGVTWNWNENADELQQSLPNVGVIAQDVEKVLPQLVTDRDNGFKGVDYAKLTGLLIEAIKEQQKQIDDLKSKLG